MHFERSTFTIGFLKGSVARERALPQGAAWELVPGSQELGAHRGALWAVPRAVAPVARAVPRSARGGAAQTLACGHRLLLLLPPRGQTSLCPRFRLGGGAAEKRRAGGLELQDAM